MTAVEQELLGAAREGDEQAFERLVGGHRGELHAHCYRMLGSFQDAEDALQEALLRAWRGLERFEGRSSLRSWLYRIATNACLTHLERRPRHRVLPIDHGPPTDPHDGPGVPLGESVWIEPYPDGALEVERRESVELAFVAALQLLPPLQRAALVLREVLGFSAAEVADALDTSVPSVNSALQRARRTIDDRLPDRTQQETLRALGDEQVRDLVARYADAWERGDVDRIVALLAQDVDLTMPPMPTWFRGLDEVVVFLREWAFSGRAYDAEGRRRVKVVPTRANGQPAFATYSWDDDAGAHLPAVLQVLTLRGDEVAEICGFVDPGVFARFGLPAQVP